MKYANPLARYRAAIRHATLTRSTAIAFAETVNDLARRVASHPSDFDDAQAVAVADAQAAFAVRVREALGAYQRGEKEFDAT